MDLLQTVRKEGSRGGRSEFSWSDVAGSQHRENYLGHSLMAPVGRWQKGKDLNWYAKAEDDKDGMSEADKRKEEMRKIKQREEDEMSRALGSPVPDRGEGNANSTELGERPNDKEVQKVISQAGKGDDEEAGGRGLGYGQYGGSGRSGEKGIMKGKEPESVGGSNERRRRSRSRERRRDDEDRPRRRKDADDEERPRRRRSRSRDREGRRHRSRSRSKERRHKSRRDEEDRERRHRHRDDEDRERRQRHRDRRSRSRSRSKDREGKRRRSRSPAARVESRRQRYD